MTQRISSIDIFRALTMLLMIFVNDLWTLDHIPAWLEHSGARDDRLGLADTVFPAFLFIVGLSIPFAVKARLKQGESKIRVFGHILRRTLTLVLMGFFMVNSENFRNDLSQTARSLWEIVMVVAFLLIWNNYKEKRISGRLPAWMLQAAGILFLLVLAITYRGGSPEEPEWMRPHWWGILGLIGWAYLVCSTLYLLSERPLVIFACWFALMVLNVQEFLPHAEGAKGFRIIVSASNHFLVMSGVLATGIYQVLQKNPPKYLFPALLLGAAAITMAYGFIVRPYWGISKILATPSWTALCAGISFGMFAIIYLISDVYSVTGWAGFIMPAGRSTLTCYLLPTLVYPVLWPLQQHLPPALLQGGYGLMKSFLFALFIILLTAGFEKINIRMKI